MEKRPELIIRLTQVKIAVCLPELLFCILNLEVILLLFNVAILDNEIWVRSVSTLGITLFLTMVWNVALRELE
ncbi:hypothetical protein [Aureibacter tunicatorum]|uniref:Uncharacterized protein n=1 Tax=Aureibacter tunicatorum TaxID=866807 RepID=A0AAE3XMS5_9BACT|nr:hypothetical protein [Aureibacter tunicatorum]MDR6238838.1 hypothetical protein [Aureibacter tunicatorum]BDD05235.1 hypothetical protein AUTU_27180 [Aureibacter tunicatorum]